MGALINDSSSGGKMVFSSPSIFGYYKEIKNLPAAVDSKYMELISSKIISAYHFQVSFNLISLTIMSRF